MSDSNPRRGDYSNGVKAFFVLMGFIGLLLFGLIFVTGHWQAAILTIVGLCLVGLAVKAIRARERDH